jgi:hypothetical protein
LQDPFERSKRLSRPVCAPPSLKSHSSRRADWADKKSAEQLASEAKKIRLGNYKTIKDAGVDIIPS